jgi:hypothetical protein
VAQSPLRAGVVAWRMVSFGPLTTSSVLHRPIWSFTEACKSICRSELSSGISVGAPLRKILVCTVVYCGAAVYLQASVGLGPSVFPPVCS